MRTPLIAGNFKMFKTVAETVSYVGELRTLVKDVRGVDIVIAPPFTAIAAAAKAAERQRDRRERRRTCTGNVRARSPAR